MSVPRQLLVPDGLHETLVSLRQEEERQEARNEELVGRPPIPDYTQN